MQSMNIVVLTSDRIVDLQSLFHYLEHTCLAPCVYKIASNIHERLKNFRILI